jgi:photosystem II stability/assembly factor-like uncharacterized protein
VGEQIWYEVKPRNFGQYLRVVEIEARTGTSVLVTAFDDGFYGTLDLGKTWTLVEYRYQGSGIIAASDPNVVYDYKKNGVIKRSENGGKTWVVPAPKIDGRSEAETAFRVSRIRDYVLEFEIAAIHPLQPMTVYATVTVVPPRRPGGDFREHYFLKGMYISEDGGENWRQFSDQVGIFDKYPHSVLLGINASDTDVMFSQGADGILRSVDGGRVWRPIGQSDLLNLEPLDEDERTRGVLPRQSARLVAEEFVFDPTSPSTVYIRSRKGIHRSLDGGDTWLLLNLGFDRLTAVNSFAVDPLQPSKVFAGTDRGLFVSEDRGCHFAKMLPPTP